MSTCGSPRSSAAPFYIVDVVYLTAGGSWWADGPLSTGDERDWSVGSQNYDDLGVRLMRRVL
jgi:hypothetical protein